jgi:chromosome segregation protein
MRLTQIKLAGFKSFVDASVLPLPSNLTSIVGPNGCGKSNLIDAVRWVLGESSMKQLRSESSEDVIFSGSRSRKPVGRAAVELVFDNSDNTLQGPYAHYSEVAVRRELTRDGGSQYFLNGSKCLRRDVVDLFLGTGLGARAGYAIIEQGMVSRMIEAKPEELRQWLEEAAGISKYRERRRETESRIRSARENLSRLNDLESELQVRIEALRKQAANAEKFKKFRQKEDELKAQLKILRLRAVEQEADRQRQRIVNARELETQAREGLDVRREAVGQAEQSLTLAQRDFQQIQARAYETEATLARHEQVLAHAREMAAMRERERVTLQSEVTTLAQRQAEARARLESLRNEAGTLDIECERAREQLSTTEALFAEADQAAEAAEAHWQTHARDSEAPLAERESERVRLRERERSLQSLTERTARVEAERAKLDPAPLEQAVEAATAELAALEESLTAAREALRKHETDIEALGAERASVDKALNEGRQRLSTIRGRLASLETLQSAALRKDDDAHAGWLRMHGLADAQRLAAVLQVSEGWDVAVEHVLGELLQAPMAPSLRNILDTDHEVPETGASAVALESDTATGSHAFSGRLSSQLQAPAPILQWLRGVHVADDLPAARQLLAKLGEGESVVTRAGVWLGPGWVRYPRRGAGQGVIARARQLEQLREQAGALDSEVRNREAELARVREALSVAEQARRQESGRVETMRQQQSRRQAQLQADRVRAEQMQQRLASLNEEWSQLNAAQLEQRAAHEALVERLRNLEETAERLRAERHTHQAAVAEARGRRNEARNAVQVAQQRLSALEVRGAGQHSAIEGAERALADLVNRHAERQRQLEAQQAAHAPDGDELAGKQAACDAARGEVATVREQLRVAREVLERAEKVLGEVRGSLSRAQIAVEQAREQVQQAQLGFQGIDAKRQTLEEQFLEAGLEREPLEAGLPENAVVEVWEEELAGVLRRIERLGAINLAAIEELEEAEARGNELARQHADIAEALDTLEAAIRKIDRETRERFRTTFDQVNTIFQARFPRLFGGGEAQLELTDQDLLTAGVRVMARPPGKRNSSIHLLSGGEKAMTAVALLLALFELNPAPFCLLDEVDAPLDDANVSRFCDVIREMSSNVQFVIITHNKITMALADHLHGVTMQEPGVSRLVSVDVQQAVELAGEAA